MLLNNLLRPNLPLFFYSLFYISSMERVSVDLSLLHTKDPYCGVQTASHMLVPFCDFSFTLTSLPVVNFIFEHYQQSGLWKVTPNCCVIIWDAPTTNDFGSYFENCS